MELSSNSCASSVESTGPRYLLESALAANSSTSSSSNSSTGASTKVFCNTSGVSPSIHSSTSAFLQIAAWWQGGRLFYDGGNAIESKCRVRPFPRILAVGRKKYLGENYPAQRQQHSVPIWHPAHQLWVSPEPLSVSQSSHRHFRWVFDQTPPTFFAQRSLFLACAHAFRHTTFV